MTKIIQYRKFIIAQLEVDSLEEEPLFINAEDGPNSAEEEVNQIGSEIKWRKAYEAWAWTATPARFPGLTSTIENPSSSSKSSTLASPVTCLALSGQMLISGANNAIAYHSGILPCFLNDEIMHII